MASQDSSLLSTSTAVPTKRWKLSRPVTLANGAKFEGELLDGRKDGFGVQIWPDGSKYEGQWADD